MIFESTNQKGETIYKFIDIENGKPFVNSSGRIINVFEECSLIEIFPNNSNYKKYKIIYNDHDNHNSILVKFKGYSVISSSEQKEDKICPTLMWNDGNHSSYVTIPSMDVAEGRIIKSWKFRLEDDLAEFNEQATLLGDQ